MKTPVHSCGQWALIRLQSFPSGLCGLRGCHPIGVVGAVPAVWGAAVCCEALGKMLKVPLPGHAQRRPVLLATPALFLVGTSGAHAQLFFSPGHGPWQLHVGSQFPDGWNPGHSRSTES